MPALVYTDSQQYLENSLHMDPTAGFPFGHSVLLKVSMSAVPDLGVVPLLTHLFGIVAARSSTQCWFVEEWL